jgi:hypothetical protein
MVKSNKRALAMLLMLVVVSVTTNAQIGVGVDAAATEVKGVFANVSNLVLMIGGVVGLVGGIKVFTKWQNGDQDVQKSITGWLGACLFLLLTGGVLKTMFGM